MKIINNRNDNKIISVGFMGPVGYIERIDCITGQYSDNALNVATYNSRNKITNKAVKYEDGGTEYANWEGTGNNEITVYN